MKPSDVQTSKFLSQVLRHKPSLVGLTLDANGWVDICCLIESANRHGQDLTHEQIMRVVQQNDKKRFAISPDGRQIRASQGHSVPVDLKLTPVEPPQFLYHGTARQNIKSILQKGVVPGKRVHVHLSSNAENAVLVGRRHGPPVVIRIYAQDMYAMGHVFYMSDNGVWLTNHIPVRFLEVE